MSGLTPEQDRQQAQPPGSAPAPGQRRDARYGIVIARPFGVPVYILGCVLKFVVAAFVVVFYANSLPEIHPTWVRYAVSATFVILLYASVLVHEPRHCVRSHGRSI